MKQKEELERLNILDISQLNVDEKLGKKSRSLVVVPSSLEGTVIVELGAPLDLREKCSPKFEKLEEQKEEEVTEYDKINRPFRPKTRPIAENVQHYNVFLSNFKIPRGARAKRMSKHALIVLIEQIYSEKFVSDANFFKASLKEKQKEKLDVSKQSFPLFVFEYFKAKIKSPKLLIQAGIDLISSIEFHRKQCLEADIFCKFMEETFDSKDLIFFLYIRSIIEKELDIKFTDLKEQNLKKKYANVLYLAKERKSISHHEVDSRNVFMNEKECMKLCGIFFEEGTESRTRLLQQFDENMIRSPKIPTERYMSTSVFLLLMLMEFKRSRIGSASRGAPSEEASPPQPSRKYISDEDFKSLLLTAIEPELEKMLSELIEEVHDIEPETENIIRMELKKVFGKHIEEVIVELLNENMPNVQKALDMAEDIQPEDLDELQNILEQIRDYQYKKNQNPQSLESIAASILQIPQLMSQIKMLVETFLTQLKAAAEGKESEEAI